MSATQSQVSTAGAPAAATTGPPRRLGLALAVIATAQLMVVLDATMSCAVAMTARARPSRRGGPAVAAAAPGVLSCGWVVDMRITELRLKVKGPNGPGAARLLLSCGQCEGGRPGPRGRHS